MKGNAESVGTVTLACVPEPNRIAFDIGAGTPNPVTAAMLKFWPQPNIGTRPTAPPDGDNDPTWLAYDKGCPNGNNASANYSFVQ